MVWKETTQLNCGHATNLINSMNKYFVVCQYFVRGNFGGAEDYEKQVGQPLVNVNSCVPASQNEDKSEVGDDKETDTQTDEESETLKSGCKTEGLTDWEEFVLEEHNKLRRQHADTPDLCYAESGDDVTFTAQSWAEELAATGMFRHSSGEKYGENIAYKSTSGVLPDRIAAYNISIHKLVSYVREFISYKLRNGFAFVALISREWFQIQLEIIR